jgi:uncharacterized protein involved in exopolysaccharide biosynthesis
VAVRALSVGIVVAVVSLFIPNKYTSEAHILPKDPKGAGMPGQLSAAAAAFGMNVGMEDASASYLDILRSWWVNERLLNSRFAYHQKPWYFGDPVRKEGLLRDYLDVKTMNKGMKAMLDVLSVDRDQKTGLITIQAETKSPDLSQQVAREAVGLLEDFITNHSQTQAGEKAKFAADRMPKAIQEALEAEARYKSFLMVHRNGPESSDPGVRLTGERLEAELDVKRQVVSTLSVSREQALLEAKDSTPVLTVLDRGNLPDEKSYPPRAIIVIAAMLLVVACHFGWRHRQWIKEGLDAE